MSILAERSIIGSLLMDYNRISEIANIVSADMFENGVLKQIYSEYIKGYEMQYPVDLVVIDKHINKDEIPQEILMGEVLKCQEFSYSAANIKTYADVLIDDYAQRQAVALLNRSNIENGNARNSISALIENLTNIVKIKDNSASTLSELSMQYRDKYFNDDVGANKVYLGFTEIDMLIGGLEGGDTAIIGARPAVGKSAFVAQIASGMSDNGLNVAYYNLEMMNQQIYERFMVNLSGIGLTRLRRANAFIGDEETKFKRANERLEKVDNLTVITGTKSVKDIRCETLGKGYDVVIVDYLQLVKVDDRYKGSRYAEIGEVSRQFKALAKELGIPIILLSQLNRASEARDTKKPTLADLRESGDIEQDASVIMFLWNKDADDRSKKGFCCEKNRQGKLGSVDLTFDGDHMRFVEGEDFKPSEDLPFKKTEEKKSETNNSDYDYGSYYSQFFSSNNA